MSVEDAEFDAAYQQLVRSVGVPMPSVVHTVEGTVVAATDGGQVRVDEWVDVLPADRRLDPAGVGRLLAKLHLVGAPTNGPVVAWYVDPVGAEASQELLLRLRMADAPFVDRLRSVVLRRATSRSAKGQRLRLTARRGLSATLNGTATATSDT